MLRQKNGFCVLVIAHKVAKIPEVLGKEYASTEKKLLRSPYIYGFFKNFSDYSHALSMLE